MTMDPFTKFSQELNEQARRCNDLAKQSETLEQEEKELSQQMQDAREQYVATEADLERLKHAFTSIKSKHEGVKERLRLINDEKTVRRSHNPVQGLSLIVSVVSVTASKRVVQREEASDALFSCRSS